MKRNLLAFTNVCQKLIARFKKHCLSLIAITALAVLVCRNLLLSPDFPAGTDMLGWINPIFYLTEKFMFFSIWGFGGFGGIQQFTLRSPLSILNLLFHNSVLLIKTFIFMTFLFSGISMYFFTYHYTKKKTASIFSSVVFVINQWYISQLVSGHLNHTFAYAMLPLLFFSFDKALRSQNFRSMTTVSVILTLILLSRFDPLAYYMPFLILYLLFTILISYHQTERKVPITHRLKVLITHRLKVLIIVGILLFCFSAIQIIPILFGVHGGYISLKTYFPIEEFKWPSLGFFESILGMARELGYLGFKGEIWWSIHPFLSFLQYRIVMSILVILAFSAIFFRKDRLTLFFVSSALISAFLAKGTSPPFGEAFLWLYFNIPFFSVLHVPNRWLMITYFSYAFLSGITVDALFVKLLNLKSPNLIKQLRSHKFFDKMFKPLPYIFLAVVTIPMFFPSWYIVSNGLQTWRPPEQHLKPHLWIAGQSGDFRVATVPYAQDYMFVGWEPKGWWEHDLGIESSLFHGRPVIGRGGWVPYASDFVDYTSRVVLENGTENLMKILGAFNVRYLVVQGYLPTQALPPGYSSFYQHYFFPKQKGLQPVYVYENSTVYENQFWTARIFGVSKYAIVVGGREALTALTTVDNFDLSDWNLLFADQIADQLGADQLLELINESPLLIFVNSELLDLAMLTLENAIRIRAVDYAYPSTDKYEHWISDDWWTNMGMLVLNRRVLLTSGNLSLSIPANVENSGEYDIWIRLLYGENRGNLSVKIDGTELGSILPYARHYSGLKWVKIGSARLEQGQHDLTLTNNKSTIEWAQGDSNNIDEILLVKPQEFKLAINKTTQSLQQSPARIISIIEGEQMFKWATTPHFTEWWTARQPFNASGGWVASTTSENTWIPLKYSILRDGRYSIALRIMVGRDQGTLRIVLDDTEYLINATSQEPAFKWITLTPKTLQLGNHTFDLYGEGKLEIDQIVIYSLNQNEDEITLDDIFKTDKPQTTISYEKINPTMYTVHVETDTPFFLVFSDAYHNLWRAYVDGEEIQSIPAYSFINTFQISKTGEYDIVIEFIGQRYVVYGGIISIGSITLAIIYLMFGVKINQFIIRKLKLKQKKEVTEDKRLNSSSQPTLSHQIIYGIVCLTIISFGLFLIWEVGVSSQGDTERIIAMALPGSILTLIGSIALSRPLRTLVRNLARHLRA